MKKRLKKCFERACELAFPSHRTWKFELKKFELVALYFPLVFVIFCGEKDPLIRNRKNLEMSRWSLFLSLLVLLCLCSQNLIVNCQEEEEGSDEQSGETSTGAVSNVLEGALQGDIYLIEKGLKQGKESIDVTNGTCTSIKPLAILSLCIPKTPRLVY